MLKFIELFAGCGGMSLGLEAANFELYFANELSPMAGETYAYNLLGEDLKTTKDPQKTLWINSQFEKGNPKRLNENPYNATNGEFADINKDSDFKRKLLIGDINQLNDFLKKNQSVLKKIINEQIDLVSGGPPCQSFSLAGRREKNNKRNQLPGAFAEFVELVKPKVVLLENVSGILRAFSEGEKKFYAWFEVVKAFSLKGYVPICMHLNARYFGLPQNRPRFIMIAIRHDLIYPIKKDEVLLKALSTYDRIRLFKEELEISEKDDFFELNNKRDISIFERSKFLISPKTIKDEEQRSVSYAIDSLKILPNKVSSELLCFDMYHNFLDSVFKPHPKIYKLNNHNHRGHSLKIQQRFKFLKLIEEFENGERNKLIHALKIGSVVELGSVLKETVIEKLEGVSNETELKQFVLTYQSKKHSQRALNRLKPAPAALSIPDDVCHYDETENRTLTVREMARIQSFPDWFEFRTKDTTGGENRKFEVPNYTQVGNAVPPLLAFELGKFVQDLLKNLK
jgi:DNA (cytosine-5)-methyltransferase 1